MTQAPAPSRVTLRRRIGFSLIELLVVISLLALLLTITFPFLNNTLQNTAVSNAQGQVSNALSAARVYATRSVPFVAARQINNTLRTADDNGDGYSGAIALFAPDNTIRILQNDQNAYDPSNLSSSGGWLELSVPPLNGYAPIPDLEDVSYPSRVQMLGIVRVGDGPYEVRLVPPPFAIRFSNEGTIAQGQDDNDPRVLFTGSPADWDRLVYVSATGDTDTIGTGQRAIPVTEYDVRDFRPTTANTTFDIDRFGYRGSERMEDGRVQLPFGVVETVSGVLVLEPERVPAQFDHPDGTNDVDLEFSRDRIDAYSVAQSGALLNWAAANSTYARVLLFNRYTGQDLTR